VGTAASDIMNLQDQLDTAESEVRALVADLSEEQAAWRSDAGSWSVAQCIDHLAATNRVYLHAMQGTAVRAREQGRLRRGPAVPGFVGRWFVNITEPPPKAPFKVKAPKTIIPRTAPLLADAFAGFLSSQDQLREFLIAYGELDLAGIGFPNPFVRGIRFSLATGLHVITAHERRHLWQAWRVRRAAERALAQLPRVDDGRSDARRMIES